MEGWGVKVPALLPGEGGDVQGEFQQGPPHPEPLARCPQALAFPHQLYDAVFDGAQVTSKTPIRLYGGALLSGYHWAHCGGGMGSWGTNLG